MQKLVTATDASNAARTLCWWRAQKRASSSSKPLEPETVIETVIAQDDGRLLKRSLVDIIDFADPLQAGIAALFADEIAAGLA